MKQRINFLTAVVLAASALTASVTGCELIASVDRSKIKGEGGSGGNGTGGMGGSTTSTSTTGTGGTGGTGGMTTTTTTSSSGGGTGGTGGMPPVCDGGTQCTMATECPAPPNECVLRACGSGCCSTTDVADNTPTTGGQTGKDCKQVVCDGNGGTKTVDDNADVPDAMDDCHVGVCNAGTPGQDLKSAGATCASNNGKVCDGNGLCVECNVNADCTAPKVCDPKNGTHTCVDASCADGVQNGTETDQDCGGSCGATCDNGKMCNMHTDCKEAHCDAGTCAAATCSDGIKDGAQGAEETDVDCGGPCVAEGKKCADTKSCANNTDCQSGYCDATKHCVQPTCTDTVKNGSETGTDCGGATCVAQGKTCPVGQGCSGPTDCATGFCGGNSLCATKPDGLPCNANSECTSTTCGTNGSGNCCTAACTTGGTCGATGCAIGTGACVYPPSGTTCGSSCTGNTLTVSTCDGSGTCSPGTPAACAGGLKCGSATACLTTCTVDTDCVSSSDFCSNGTCTPKKATGACTGANQCTSGVCDVDGTGNCCTASCTTGGTCGATGCDSGTGACSYPTSTCGSSCTGNMLTVSTCNGSGTCSPGTPAACANGLKCGSATACLTTCTVDTDCASSGDYCSSGMCVPKEANGDTCTGDNECTSGICDIDGSGNCCTATCNTSHATCGATGCASGSGACSYPGTSTMVPTGQTTGDCQKIVCNGSGSTTSVDDSTDLPVSNTVCLTTPACTGTPLAPSFTPAAAGTDCTADGQAGKKVCGSGLTAGTCVECNANSDCTAASCSGTVFTSAGTCSASNTCTAGSSTDCATTGQVCNATAGCVQCNTNADCASTPATPVCNTTLHTCE